MFSPQKYCFLPISARKDTKKSLLIGADSLVVYLKSSEDLVVFIIVTCTTKNYFLACTTCSIVPDWAHPLAA